MIKRKCLEFLETLLYLFFTKWFSSFSANIDLNAIKCYTNELFLVYESSPNQAPFHLAFY